MPKFSRFAAVAALSLALANPAGASAQAVAQTQAPACPSNSTWTGTQCACDEGYTSVGGTRCVSEAGVCGEHSRLSGTRCVCDAGYLSYRDQCVTPADYCSRTGAVYDTTRGSCVCPENTMRNFRTGACTPLLGATLRARLTALPDPLAGLATATISSEASVELTQAVIQLTPTLPTPTTIADITRQIATIEEVFAPVKIEPIILTAMPRIETVRLQSPILVATPTITTQDLFLANPIQVRPATDPRLAEIQTTMDAGLLTLSTQTADLAAAREAQLRLLSGSTVRTPAETTTVVQDLSRTTTAVQTTMTDLSAIERLRQATIISPTPTPAPAPAPTPVPTPTPAPTPIRPPTTTTAPLPISTPTLTTTTNLRLVAPTPTTTTVVNTTSTFRLPAPSSTLTAITRR